MSTGTIIVPNAVFNAIGNGYVPDIPGFESIPGHKLTLLLGAIGIVAYIFSEISSRRKKQAYGFEVLPRAIFIVKLVLLRLSSPS